MVAHLPTLPSKQSSQPVKYEGEKDTVELGTENIRYYSFHWG